MLNNKRWIIIIFSIGLVAAVVTYQMQIANTCSFRQLSLAGEIKNYDKTLDAQVCDKLNSKISQFNSQCKYSLEELDCG